MQIGRMQCTYSARPVGRRLTAAPAARARLLRDVRLVADGRQQRAHDRGQRLRVHDRGPVHELEDAPCARRASRALEHAQLLCACGRPRPALPQGTLALGSDPSPKSHLHTPTCSDAGGWCQRTDAHQLEQDAHLSGPSRMREGQRGAEHTLHSGGGRVGPTGSRRAALAPMVHAVVCRTAVCGCLSALSRRGRGGVGVQGFRVCGARTNGPRRGVPHGGVRVLERVEQEWQAHRDQARQLVRRRALQDGAERERGRLAQPPVLRRVGLADVHLLRWRARA